jgi:acetyl esterase/lipase
MAYLMNKKKLPGLLGDNSMTLSTDPRTDPRMLEGLAKVRLDVPGDVPPVSLETPMEQLYEYATGVESFFQHVNRTLFADLPAVDGVISRTEKINGTDGNEISLFIHQPEDMEGPLPCVYHTHGGGMVILSATGDNFVRWRSDLAASGLVVVGVEFRNGAGDLGNHPFPAGLNDCVAGLNWVFNNRENLNISNIILSGESGGANLAISTTLKAKQEGWLDRISGVYAQCPYIYGLYSNPSEKLVSLFENNGYMFDLNAISLLAKFYDPSGENSTNPLAWPFHATKEDLVSLPPYVISLNELDPLRDEGAIFHQKLLEAGVSSTCRTINGTCHAGDLIFKQFIPDIYMSVIQEICSFANSIGKNK